MISLFDLVQPFLSCEDLAFKPKLFFFLACRGECMEFQGANEQSSEIFLFFIYRVLMNSYWKNSHVITNYMDPIGSIVFKP